MAALSRLRTIELVPEDLVSVSSVENMQALAQARGVIPSMQEIRVRSSVAGVHTRGVVTVTQTNNIKRRP